MGDFPGPSCSIKYEFLHERHFSQSMFWEDQRGLQPSPFHLLRTRPDPMYAPHLQVTLCL